MSATGHGHHHEETGENRSPYEARARAMGELLVEKGILTEDEIKSQIEYMESLTPVNGARLAARAWVDPAFKELLLSDTKAAAMELGIDVSGTNEFVTVENTGEVHNVIVCTLCSCYPRAILGRPPGWYKSFAYRSRVVVEPREVLREFGLEIPVDKRIAVHDSSADIRYLVLPQRPEGTGEMNEEELASLVTRDSLIGTDIPRRQTAVAKA